MVIWNGVTFRIEYDKINIRIRILKIKGFSGEQLVTGSSYPVSCQNQDT